MFTNEIVEGIAKKLKGLYPDKKVEVEAISSNAIGKIFITVAESSNKNELGGVRKTDLSFDISYWCKDSENMSYNDWLANMYKEFTQVETDTATYSTKNMSAQKGEGVYHFLFDLTFRYRIMADNYKMSSLRQKGGTF